MTPAPEHTLIQFTDLHLVADGVRYAIDPAEALTRALAAVEESGVAPSALLFTGDLTDEGEPAAYERLRGLVEPVAARLGAPALFVMGNHDDRAALRTHLLGIRPTGGPADTAPLDHVTRIGDLRVVVLDSTVPGHAHGELTPDQLAWLEAELTEPAPTGTVLALHHPPLPSPSRLSAAIELQRRTTLGAVLSGTDVRIVLAGHTHLVSAGAVAGVPVWTGGATSYVSDALVPAGEERALNAQTVSRIDLFADSVVAAAVPVGADRRGTLSAAEVEQRVAELRSRTDAA
ncbi:metallophosphoesterase [Pseudonocardia xinjiangensis]|uniref:metallophosphoesterase n=1 Tax=Pseudonocardia xinjiangensis TaxID=75289 RepID=UPI003D92D8C7